MNAKEQYIHSNEPATKGDLEELREELQADMVNNFATKDDLKELREELQADMVNNFATKDELKAALDATESRLINELKNHFDAAVEIMREEIAGGNQDDISNIKDKTDRLDDRVGVLERHNGLA